MRFATAMIALSLSLGACASKPMPPPSSPATPPATGGTSAATPAVTPPPPPAVEDSKQKNAPGGKVTSDPCEGGQ